jgi:hypothetical protein
MNYKLWNRQEMINGVASSHFLNQQPFKDYKGDIILIYADNGKVSNVECKDILSNIYGIDKDLPLDEFMSEYFAKLEEMNKASEEIIEE